MREAKWIEVILVGGIGGLFSWLYPLTFGQELVSPWYKAIPLFIAFGMGAAFIGVYVLANSDRRDQMRCLGFALLCGFAWKFVWDSGNALIHQTFQLREEKRVVSLSEESKELARKLPTIQTDQLPAKINETTTTTIQAVQALPKIKTMEVREAVMVSTNEVISALNDIASKKPHEAVTALKELGETSIKSGEPQIVPLAINSLAAVSQDPMQSTDTRKEASQFAVDIASLILRDYKIDIYYEKDKAESEKVTRKVESIIKGENLAKKVVLIPVTQDFFKSTGMPRANEVRYESRREDEAAQALATVINLIDFSLNFRLRPVVTRTPGTLSIFVWTEKM